MLFWGNIPTHSSLWPITISRYLLQQHAWSIALYWSTEKTQIMWNAVYNREILEKPGFIERIFQCIHLFHVYHFCDNKSGSDIMTVHSFYLMDIGIHIWGHSDISGWEVLLKHWFFHDDELISVSHITEMQYFEGFWRYTCFVNSKWRNFLCL